MSATSEKSRSVLRRSPRVRYAFIHEHCAVLPVRLLCGLLEVHRSDYYAWRRHPHSARSIEDRCLSGLIKQFRIGGGGVYGYRKMHPCSITVL